MKLEMKAMTDVGLVRELNEDNYKIVPEENLAVVCDGMGGHAAGEVASELAVETIGDTFLKKEEAGTLPDSTEIDEDFLESGSLLSHAVRMANRRIFNQSKSEAEVRGMGTTVVAALFDDERVIVCHVGDSRAYRLRNGNLEQLTVDHSWMNELISTNQLSEEESESFANKNVITRALGTRANVKVDIRQDRVCNDDLYLLCSDGLCGFVSDGSILKSLVKEGSSLEDMAGELIEKAKQGGGDDNITVALIRVSDVAKDDDFKKELYQQTIEEETREESKHEDDILDNLYSREDKEHTAKVDTRPFTVQKKRSKISFGWILLTVLVAVVILGYLAYTYDVGGFKVQVDKFVESISGESADQDVKSTEEKEIVTAMTNIKFDGFPDSLLDHTLFVDMIPVGTLRQYSKESLGIDPGYHTLELKNDSGIVVHRIYKSFSPQDVYLTPAEFSIPQ